MFPDVSGVNLVRSLKALRGVLRDDRSFHRLGLPRGWYLRSHYWGRLNERLKRPHQFKRAVLRVADRSIALNFSEPYVGALKGIFLDNEYQCAELLGFAPRRILDLGANIGFGSLYLSTLFPGAQFVLVEPDPRNIGPLKENLRLNDMSNVVVIEAAIGPKNCRLELRYGDDPTCSTLRGTSMHSNEHSVSVQVLTIPELMETIGWSDIDLVKIDIEGAEEMLLASESEWLRKVRAILVEIHPNTTFERISGYLQPYGFTLRRLGQGREPVYFGVRRTAT